MTPAEALVKRLRHEASFCNRLVSITERNIGELLSEAATALESLAARPQTVTEALEEITKACELDCGVPDENDGDDESVAATQAEHGPIKGSALTFGILRRARIALAAAPPPTRQWPKIRHRGVFIERQLQDAAGNYKYICHTGISKFLPDLYDTQDEAIKAVDAKLLPAPPKDKPGTILNNTDSEDRPDRPYDVDDLA